MMEAEDYFSAYDALHMGSSPVRRLEVRLRNVSNISKVVWSSFDFMCGPELKFVWEFSPSSSVSPINLSGEEGSVNDAESLDSSVSTQSVQFEDIDDPLQTALASTTGLYDSMFMDDSMYHQYHLSSRVDGYTFQELRYLDEFMVDSNYSGTESNSTMTNSRMQERSSAARSTSSATTLTMQSSSEKLDENEEVLTSTGHRGKNRSKTLPESIKNEGSVIVTGLGKSSRPRLLFQRPELEDDQDRPIDPMVGTPMELLNISSLLSSDRPGLRESQDTSETATIPARNASGSTSGGKTSTSSFAKLSDDDVNNPEKAELEEKDGADGEKTSNALTTSCVDSGIGGTISTHSELSVLCLSPLAESSPKDETKTIRTTSRGTKSRMSHGSTPGSFDDDVVSFLDLPLDLGSDQISDELFVAKFVLAEQVFSVQLPSNPLMHKMKVVPSRNLLVGSFIFSIHASGGNKTIHAISFLMSICKQEWYMERQQFFETVVLDIVPRLKASMVAEDWEDVVIRSNVELTRLMHLITVLDRYPLVSESRPIQIKNTLLTGRRCYNDKVLCKAISGVLQSQGQCAIIGSDNQYVSRLLHTLAAFIPEQLRWCCPRMYRHKFSPYLRLQVVRRYELPYLMQCGALSTWPICVVDVDRATVCMSAPYSRHRILKQRADAQRVEIVLEGSIKNKAITLEMSSCRILDCVKSFLKRVDLLPVEESARMGLVNQLHLYVENMARALILYVQHASEPLPTEKLSATKSSRFSLSECRKALDLQSDGWFHAVLARAELIAPDLAEFIYSSV